MNKEAIEKLPTENRKRMAVAYLIKHKEERPANTEKLFKKLVSYEDSTMETHKAIDQAQNAINELQDRFVKMMGSIEAIVDLIAEDLPDDKIQGWCEKYEPPVMPAQHPQGAEMSKDLSMPGKRIIVPAGNVDLAGVTAKQ